MLDVVNLRSMLGVEASMEPPLTVLADLQRQGLVRHIGLSNVTPAQIAEGRRICEIVCVQNYYNVAYRNDDGLIDSLAGDRIAYVPFFPLGGFTPLQSSTLSGVAEALGATHASRARVAASPSAKRSSHSGHVVVGASSREPRGSGSRSARRSVQTVGRYLIPGTRALSPNE